MGTGLRLPLWSLHSQRSASLLSGPPWAREPYRELVRAVGALQLGVAVAAGAKGHACETAESFVPATLEALQSDSLDQKQVGWGKLHPQERASSFPHGVSSDSYAWKNECLTRRTHP